MNRFAFDEVITIHALATSRPGSASNCRPINMQSFLPALATRPDWLIKVNSGIT